MSRRRRVRAASVAGLTGLVAAAATMVAMNTAHADEIRYEAEDSPAECSGDIESEHDGFSGSGFCNTENEEGASARFTIDANAAGTATLGIRYANGGGGDRPADVAVNGSTSASAAFEDTGEWTNWTTETLTVDLDSGENTIEFTATDGDGLPNLDYLDVTTDGTPPDDTTTPPDDPTTPDDPTDPPTGDALYASPDGSEDAAGTESDPTTITAAIAGIEPGGTIYLRGGTYDVADTIYIEPGHDGLEGDRTELFAYPGETPVIDFSAQEEDSSNRGIAMGGDWWHFKGLIVQNAGDNGILLGGDHNIIERVVTRHNADTGLQLSRYTAGAPRETWPSYNLVVSSESHDNVDSDGEDADGFAAKLTSGPGNVFRNTVAHNNIDDGWDLYTKDETGAIGAVTIENSLAYENGTLSDGGQAGSGDRNGFKLGGEDIPVDHTITNSIAYDNGKHGFTYNSNPGSMTVTGNASIGNAERNFNFDGGSSTFRDNTSCDSGDEDRIIGNDAGGNQWWEGSNGSRCSQYSGSMEWSFASDGSLVVTFGGNQVLP